MKKYTYVPGAFVAVWLIWELVVRIGGFNEALLPTPYKVLLGFGELIGDGVLFKDVADSLVRFFIGYVISVVAGVFLGLILGWYKGIWNYINPIVQVIRPISPVAWLPFIVLFFGIGQAPAIVIIFIAAFFPVLLSTVSAIQNIDPVYIKVARNFGIKQPELLFKIVLPAVFPGIASGLHIALGTAWIFLVTGEMVGSQTGLGFLIIDMRNNLRNDLLMVAILTIGFVGLLLDWGVSLIEKWIYRRWGIEGYISVRNAHKEFMKDGEPLTILENINLDIERGEFICLLGPSGSGKSTLLNAMAGFELVTSGSVTIDGAEVKAPQLRYVTVFQNYGLLPWRTVESNIELGLESKNVPKEERPAIIDKYVKMVGLDHARNRYPAELSGGMQQRVSIARALAVDPDIIFMDEPLGALDALTRINLQDEISRICREEGKTVVFVTHDIEEAVVLADRVVVLAANPGRVQTIIPVNLIDRTDRTSASFVNIRNHIFEQFQLAKEDKIEFYI